MSSKVIEHLPQLAAIRNNGGHIIVRVPFERSVLFLGLSAQNNKRLAQGISQGKLFERKAGCSRLEPRKIRKQAQVALDLQCRVLDLLAKVSLRFAQLFIVK